ncbi:MAG: hypothetical protein ACYCWE_02030 [Eubacteriales bacterium]
MNLRIISIITLMFIIFSSMLASCAKTLHVPGEEHAETAGFLAADTKAELKPELPEADYEGYTFRILHWWVDGWESRLDKDLYSEAETGDVLKDAVYRRNLKVEEQFNIKITLEHQTYSDVPTTVKNIVIAADDAYDLVYIRTYESPSVVTAGYLNDFNELPYVNLRQPWWDRNAAESYSIQGKLYLAASDINVIDKDATAVITFNKKMAAGLNLPDLYYLVLDGKWTMDKMASLYKNAAQDVDGDGKMSLDDIWGFIAGRDIPTAFFNGAGSVFASKDEKDMPVYTFESEYNYAVADKILEIMSDKTSFYNHHTGTDAAPVTDDTEYRKLFENGRGLFFWTRLDDVTAMRASETDFGILPTPKYKETQDNYYNLVNIHTAGLMSVPISAGDLERTSVILESMAFESSSTVQPAYKDVALKGKYIRDEESLEILDIIFANRVFDIGILYGFGGFVNAFDSLDSVKNGVASLYASKADAIANDILAFAENIKALNEKPAE